MTKEHTPTPWYNIANDIYHESEYGSDPIASVCGECSFNQDQANAAHIVKCVNMHDELVEALEDAIQLLQMAGYSTVEHRAALAKARGEV